MSCFNPDHDLSLTSLFLCLNLLETYPEWWEKRSGDVNIEGQSLCSGWMGQTLTEKRPVVFCVTLCQHIHLKSQQALWGSLMLVSYVPHQWDRTVVYCYLGPTVMHIVLLWFAAYPINWLVFTVIDISEYYQETFFKRLTGSWLRVKKERSKCRLHLFMN